MSTIQFQEAPLDQKKMVMDKVDDLLGKGVAPKVIGELRIILATGKRVELFLVSNQLMDIFKKTKRKRNPYCLGLYFGDLLNNELLLSIEGATLCSPYTDRKVKVSHKGEQAVLYGRDVQRSLIENFPSSIRLGQKVIIINRLDEALALGRALIYGKEFHDAHKDTSVIKNILDRGWYLRKGA
jgi:ribosome biogenesis protein Nip4